MNINALKCFEAVYEEKSISKAARRLYITPQGLSKNIQLLENELETCLFERTRQGVFPTKSGEFLYERAGKIIRELEEVEYGIRQLENQQITLRIGYACGVFNVLPFALISEFVRENPGINVTWCEYANPQVKEMLSSSLLEYGFIVGTPEDRELSARKLASNAVVLLVYEGHPLYDCEWADISLLRNEKIITMNEYFHIYHDLINACRACGFTPDIAAKTADGQVLYKLCRQKAGLAVTPEFLLEGLALTNIRAVKLRADFQWDVYGAYKEDTKNYSVIRSFDTFLSENM